MRHKKLVWDGSGGFSEVVAEDILFKKGEVVEVEEEIAERLLTNTSFSVAKHVESYTPAELSKAELPAENKLEKNKGENK